MKAKIKERIKTLVIIFLALSALFLAYKSTVFNELIASTELFARVSAYFKPGGTLVGTVGNEGADTSPMQAVRPVCMAVVNEIGARRGEKYNAAGLDNMYEKTVNIFGEALGSAALPEECGESEWRRALGTTGIFLNYEADVPIASLIKWLGLSAAAENNDSASSFIVAAHETGVTVYYSSLEKYYKCSTAARAESLVSAAAEFLPNGAYFAYEEEKCAGIAPYTLILPSDSEKYAVSSKSAVSGGEMIYERLAEAFGINVLGGANRTEKDGTMVFVASLGVIKLHPDGLLNYSAMEEQSGETEPPLSVSDEKLVERTLEIISLLRSDLGGEERVILSSLERSGEKCSVSFDYYIDGTRIIPKSGRAATAVFQNGKLIFVDIWLRSYNITDERCVLLPELQAAAIAAGAETGSSLRMVYYDSGEDKILPTWVRG